jgi:hypothetical protein
MSLNNMKHQYNDGGRAQAGYKGDTGDCVTRAIAIATEQPYQTVYDAMFAGKELHRDTKRDRLARRLAVRGASPRNGCPRKVYDKYLKALGWAWQPTMRIGTGCRVHLAEGELPQGRLIVRVSKHVCAVIDGTINDTYDPSRDGTRCVYGYYYKPE